MLEKKVPTNELIKYHVMNTLESTVNTKNKSISMLALVLVASSAYFIPQEIEHWHSAFDDVGIESQQQTIYKQLSEQIVSFQTLAEQLPTMEEKLDFYDYLDSDEKTPEIKNQEAQLKLAFIDTKAALNKQIKQMSVTAFNSGNTTDGIAISEQQLDELWSQLDLTEPSLRVLHNNFDIDHLPDAGMAYIDECRIETKINKESTLNVQYNAASKIARCSHNTKLGHGALTAIKIAGITGMFSLLGFGINSNRKNKFGYYNQREKPQPPRGH